MGLSHHEGIAKRECAALHGRDPFQQLSVLSWHGKHLRWSTAIQLSCQSWWELQCNTSPEFRSGDREAALQLDFPHCSPYTFHLFFLCTSGFPIPAPILKNPLSQSHVQHQTESRSQETFLGFRFHDKPEACSSRRSANLWGKKDFLDSQLLQDVPNKGKEKKKKEREVNKQKETQFW